MRILREELDFVRSLKTLLKAVIAKPFPDLVESFG